MYESPNEQNTDITSLRPTPMKRISNPRMEALFPSSVGKELFLKKVNEAIYRNLDNEEFKSVSLCKDLGISRSQLFRKIKDFTGFSTALYIRHIRMEASKELLTDEAMTIRIIAYAVGFRDVAYFSRCFKKAYGVCPTEYRAALLKI